MIEATIRTYLSSALSGVSVYVGETPADKPSEYVVIEVADNGRINFIDAVTLNITSHSTSLQSAAELNAKVKAAMYDAVSVANVSSSKCGGGGQQIDTTTKAYEYECVFNLYYTE